MTITPKKLRNVADTLKGSLYAFEHGGEIYMCFAYKELYRGRRGRDEFTDLLETAGCALCGDLGMTNEEYEETAMPVRFMFLEFLALYLETR